SAVLAPLLGSPERSSPAALNKCTNDAKRSGSGVETTSAKQARKPSASISGKPRCIATGSSDKEPSPRGLRPKAKCASAGLRSDNRPNALCGGGEIPIPVLITHDLPQVARADEVIE